MVNIVILFQTRDFIYDEITFLMFLGQPDIHNEGV